MIWRKTLPHVRNRLTYSFKGEFFMKKLASFALLVLCATALFQPSSGYASEKEQILNFDGAAWATMNMENKESFLFGMQNAIAIEYALSMEKAHKAGKAPTLENVDLSPFEKGWAMTFSKSTRQQIAQDIDEFYAAHPDQSERHVLDVIWKELIMPAQKNR